VSNAQSPSERKETIRRSAPYVVIALYAAVLAVICIAPPALATEPSVSLEHYRAAIARQHDWTNRALENRCRSHVRLADFTRTPLSSVAPAWRDDRIAYARAKHQDAKASSSLCVPWYVTKQIWAANLIGAGGDAGGTDPWPNCPDPYDHAGDSWYDTVGCENGGSWLDSPGYYRCGLQFAPSWETKYGRLCP
jgi:hypothetical protein